jgi:hypothetical protein
LIYPYYEGDDDGDGDVDVDDEDGTSPHDKGVLVVMKVLISVQRWPWICRAFSEGEEVYRLRRRLRKFCQN